MPVSVYTDLWLIAALLALVLFYLLPLLEKHIREL